MRAEVAVKRIVTRRRHLAIRDQKSKGTTRRRPATVTKIACVPVTPDHTLERIADILSAATDAVLAPG
jgi:hypothetical protein